MLFNISSISNKTLAIILLVLCGLLVIVTEGMKSRGGDEEILVKIGSALFAAIGIVYVIDLLKYTPFF